MNSTHDELPEFTLFKIIGIMSDYRAVLPSGNNNGIHSSYDYYDRKSRKIN